MSVLVTSPPKVYASLSAVRVTLCGSPLCVNSFWASEGFAICVFPPFGIVPLSQAEKLKIKAKMKMRLQ